MKTRIKNNNLLNFKCTLNVDVLVITRYISQTQVAISQYQTCNKELLTRRGAPSRAGPGAVAPLATLKRRFCI